ncbi:MAG: hypothetical protein PVH30_04295 [Desulfobacterales bacterium]
MTKSPPFSFFLYDDDPPVDDSHPLWDATLPAGPSPAGPAAAPFTYREYFAAAAQYLAADGFRPVILGTGLNLEAIQRIAVRLVKHGAFYHPAQVVVQTHSGIFRRVLNVAVSAVGFHQMDSELEALSRLAAGPEAKRIPTVYHSGRVDMPSGRSVGCFLGEWFSGYWEFHLSRDPESGDCSLVLWDEETGHRTLPADQSVSVYQGAARILTGCFNPETADEVLSWHHAAGDFVANVKGSRAEVKLVTARGYGSQSPINGGGMAANEVRLLNILLFFARLAIRNALDRLDGTGEWVWAGWPSVRGTVRGVFDGLAPEDAIGFFAMIREYDAHAYGTILDAVADSYHPDAPDGACARQHLSQLAQALEAAVAAESIRRGG